jgi:hypothetical protein
MTAMISSTVGGFGRVAHSLVSRRSAGVIAEHRRRRATSPGGIENGRNGHGILLPTAQLTEPVAL